MQLLVITVEVKSQDQESFVLEVINTITEKTFTCKDLSEMNEIITTLYELYPEHELQVEWLRSPLAYPHHIATLREQIAHFQAENNLNI